MKKPWKITLKVLTLLTYVACVMSFNINEGDTLARGYHIDTIPTVEAAWYVSFEVNPTATVAGWSNVIHFTIKNNIGTYGDRVPGVWFINRSTRLHICSAVSGNGDHCFQTKALPFSTYTKIEISNRFQSNGQIWYEIRVGGVKVYSVHNTRPAYFPNVKVYRADPWHNPSMAKIRNLVYTNLPHEHKLVRSQIVKTFPTYHQEYDLSLDVKPLGVVRSWGSIVHVTKWQNIATFGDRIPAIWFHPGNKRLHICSSVGSNRNHCVNGNADLPTNRFTNIRISQLFRQDTNAYWYVIHVDKKLIHQVKNTNPITLSNVKVYMADPWYSAANALVKNLKITTSQGGGFAPHRPRVFSYLPKVERQWYLAFSIKPTGTHRAWSNIVHLTTGSNIGAYGDRTPGIWFHKDRTSLHICTALNGNANYCWNSQNLPLNKFTKVEIKQTWDVTLNEHRLIISLDDVVRHTTVNHATQELKNVIFYASDPWHFAAKAVLKNLIFQNLPQGFTYGRCLNFRSKSVNCIGSTSLTSFRTVDGTCNNIQNPSWGASNIPLRRVIAPAYAQDDKHDTPRGFPGTYPILPAPNAVSRELFTVEHANTGNKKLVTTLFMTFGQFLDHDVTLTPQTSCRQKCNSFNGWQYPCFPLLFDSNGPRCSASGRSHPICNDQPYTQSREQLNDLSAYVDGSQIYSNDKNHFKKLRSLIDGKLKIQANGLLPVERSLGSAGCFTQGGCSLAGDFRVDENIALHSMHTIWVREHNRIATQLKSLNLSWNDEKLFQTARKITGAVWQHITFKEYVPLLTSIPVYAGYKDDVDPSITNVFATAAFRYGHSLIPNEFSQLDNSFNNANPAIPLQNVFFNRKSINDRGIEQTVRGLIGNMSNNVDNKFSFAIARKLFLSVGSEGYLDLTAINIQRGRDHGLPGYNEYRKHCGLSVVTTWTQIRNLMITEAALKFEKIYEHPDDIDVFAGGISEKHLTNFEVGPTFHCLLGRQFQSLRDGDRFYYENPGVFTTAQLAAIKNVKLSTVLCENLKGLVSVQPDAFFTPEKNSNTRKVCNSIPKLDLNSFKDNSVGDEQREATTKLSKKNGVENTLDNAVWTVDDNDLEEEAVEEQNDVENIRQERPHLRHHSKKEILRKLEIYLKKEEDEGRDEEDFRRDDDNEVDEREDGAENHDENGREQEDFRNEEEELDKLTRDFLDNKK